MKQLLLIILCFLLVVPSYSQQLLKDSQSVFTLGEVVVKSNQSPQINTNVNATEMLQFGKTDVAKALGMLPGVNVSAVGPRNESMVYVRGFDLRQVPLLIDGIPVYIPYDGYVDLARFTTFDLAEVNVSKGYTSVLYGPNALGGAINLITKKPVKKFELNGASGWLSGGYRANINIGSNFGKFYVQAGASKLKRDFFPLSAKFIPSKTEDGGNRNNSLNSDEKYNIKIGYTPNLKSEYALSYIYQHGKKGTPVYTGGDTLNSQYKNPRFWQWPYWDKQSLYFISKTTIDSTQYIKTRFYYDQFKNLLNSYDDATYTTITKPYAFKSYYNDYTFGGIAEYGKAIATKDNVQATLQYKQDVHREHNEGEPVRTMSDYTLTAGIENQLMLFNQLTFLTGFSYNNRASIKAQDYNSTTKKISDFPGANNKAFNLQGGLDYKINTQSNLSLSVARKTRFATTKDRYSYRLGTAIPNPNLHAESALNYDLSYKGNIVSKLNMRASIFYSKVSNTILNVSNVLYDSARRAWQSQLQNAGESEFMGVEVGFECHIIPSLNVGTNYTYIKRNNLTNSNLYFTDVPKHKLFAFLQYQLYNRLNAQVSTEYNSARYSTSYGAVAGSYMLLNTSATVHVYKWFSAEFGINNIMDKNYALAEGYPEPGRNYFINLTYRL